MRKPRRKSTCYFEKNGDEPLVSIVIPVYNGSNYLSEAIDSALAQTYTNIEVIVINDGSNDNDKTRDIALSYGRKIRYFEKENGGVSTALNLGIREMRGEYFAWLSHDDLFVPGKIEININAITSNNRKCIVYSDCILFEGTCHSGSRVISAGDTSRSDFQFILLSGNSIHGCTLLIPKEAFSEHGVFDPTLRYVQDYDMWFRLASSYTFFRIPMPLVLGRNHENQDTTRKYFQANEEVDAHRAFLFKHYYLASDKRGARIRAYAQAMAIYEFANHWHYVKLREEAKKFIGKKFWLIKFIFHTKRMAARLPWVRGFRQNYRWW